MIICTHPHQLLNQPLDVWLKVPFIREVWRHALPFPHPLENVENFKCLRCIFSNLTQKTHELHNSKCSRYKVQFPNCSCQFLKFIFHVKPQTSALWWNQFLLARLACPLHYMGFACHALNAYTRLLWNQWLHSIYNSNKTKCSPVGSVIIWVINKIR